MLTVPTIIFTQGDTVVMTLNAADGNGNPTDITGATFTSFIRGAGGVVFSFPNSQHAIIDAANGVYTLTLASADSANCGIGSNKDILTLIQIGSTQVNFLGKGILQVNPPVPLQ